MSGWIVGGGLVAVLVGLLSLDWFMAGRVGRRLRRHGSKPHVGASGADLGLLQAELRRAEADGSPEA